MVLAVLRFVLSLCLFSLFTAPLSAAEKRVALIIGNSAYKHAPELANPKNDAADIAAALEAHGFHVITGSDLDKAGMDRTIRDFSVALSGADAGVFFYAGHGLQVGGVNYLVPIDAQLGTAASLDWEMVRLDLVQRTMEREANTNILFLDACRDNPLARNLARALGTRSADIGRGLAATESGIGTLISFSTQPGNVALDGTGRNSPFAAALVRGIRSSTDPITDLLVTVRNDVMQATSRTQVPWEHSALTGRFYFKAPVGMPPPSPPPASEPTAESSAERHWEKIKDTTNVRELEAFVRHYGDTFHGDLARIRIDALRAKAAVETVEPVALPSRPETELDLPARGPDATRRVKKDVSLGYLNLRKGPGTNNIVITRIPAGSAGVHMAGPCLRPADGSSRFPFCLVEWEGYRGWVSLNGLD